MPAVKTQYYVRPYQEFMAALETVEVSGASMSAKLCLRFLVLTAARPGEVRSARWNEIHMGQTVWTILATSSIPARSSSTAHRCRSRRARTSDASDLVFPSPRCWTDMLHHGRILKCGPRAGGPKRACSARSISGKTTNVPGHPIGRV